ncbi:molybdopterin molybdenumtransferase MoeA [Pseudodesulfovibrio sp. F-1]|uniref:Molybdopterin molybdenumtransferase n=1 Tax=Pseudodesulfovibrio alkaliphilus TaxID=2661613 RepID=A0A7K1KKG7_9BACT|nr:molybdopterin molybdenumtransferase MoeA [Pseudodesulfovibrio alkaliphilus]
MKDRPIPRTRAIRRLLDTARPTPPTQLPPMECAGLTAAEAVAAGCDVPERASSVRDGYAVCTADIAAATTGRPAVLRVTHTVRAETDPLRPVEPGTAARVLTGGILPPGSDAVLAEEDVIARGCGHAPCPTHGDAECIEVRGPVRPGWFVRTAGGEIAGGDVFIQRGQEISPQAVAVMLRTRVSAAWVHPAPRARVVALGSELSDPTHPGPDTPPQPAARFPADNLILTSGLLARCGISSIETGVLPDHEDRLTALLAADGLPELVITTGGTGRSERDFARAGARRAGFETLFDALDIRPGRNMFAAHRDTTLLIALPGPPTAVFACFHAVVLPALRRLRGLNETAPVTARLDATLSSRPGGEWLAPCTLSRHGGHLCASMLAGKDTPPMLALGQADGVAVMPGGETLLAGDRVEVLTTLF